MKAVVVTAFGGPEVLRVVDVARPDMNSHQVLIKVHATSVNFADIKARYGQYHNTGTPPFIPGLDDAGTIEAVGSEVTRFRPGQRVIAFPANGSYAEYIVVDETLTFALPPEVDWDTAAACPLVSFTSYALLHDVARLKAGEVVFVHAAAGGIGTVATQLAKILGAGMVIGAVSRQEKIAASYAAGADHVICYPTEPFAERVNTLTDGHGADVILDSVAGPITQQSLSCLAPYGRLVVFGNASGEPGIVQTTDLHASCRSVLGYSLGTTRKNHPHLLQVIASQVLPLIAKGRLNVPIGMTVPLADAAIAQQWVENRQSTGKAILKVVS
ncbi:quinone oxidoreductase [Sulfobacillus thermotolerans]|uniref:Quinone oxidoreductase n=1 Tax=Sulfobacillus thermotolerans TaxID=338644 RepID=A0ABM6RTN6_9FIRM|nr:quinone oxidoreductase [Sulfobacillus thermotolerans]